MIDTRRDRLQYRGFLAMHKAMKQSWPNMCNEELLIRAIAATSDDKWPRARRLNTKEIAELDGGGSKSVFSDALTRRR